ncbi:MAG TPA: phosphatase PAP2 family protein [Gemmatimonadales bacterium]
MACVLLLGVSPGVAAQSPTTPIAVPKAAAPHTLRWWEAAIVVWPALGLMTADASVTHEFREHATSSAEHLAATFRRVGQPEVYALLPLGVLATGAVMHNPAVVRAGGRLVATVVVSTVAFQTLKLVSGRARPDAEEGPIDFRPFSGQASFPSGHSTVAFALATSISDDLHNPWATAALYGIAAGTAWSRVYNERHWASDVVVGAALGVTCAKVVSGRWRIFGLQPPSLLLEPDRVGVSVPLPHPHCHTCS